MTSRPTSRPIRRGGGHVRRTRPVRRASAGLTPVRAAAVFAMLASAGAIYGLTASSAFGVSQIDVTGATITGAATITQRLDLATGQNLFDIATEPLEAGLRQIPAVAAADVSIGLPDRVSVTIVERRPIVVWRVGERRLLVDDGGLLFAELDPSASVPALDVLPVVTDNRATAASLGIGMTLDTVDLDAAFRLASLTPAQVGSAAAALTVAVTDDHGFVVSSGPKGWDAIFGFYGLSLRTTDLIPGQVQLLKTLLVGREDAVKTVILADDREGTYVPKATPKASASPKP
jgi:cell division septal protein FtsQ